MTDSSINHTTRRRERQARKVHGRHEKRRQARQAQRAQPSHREHGRGRGQRPATPAELAALYNKVRNRTAIVKHSCGCWIEWDALILSDQEPGEALALKAVACNWGYSVRRWPCPWHGSASGVPSTAPRIPGGWVVLASAPFPMRYRDWPERDQLPSEYPYDAVVVLDSLEPSDVQGGA